MIPEVVSDVQALYFCCCSEKGQECIESLRE
jgi:hypothetical protein